MEGGSMDQAVFFSQTVKHLGRFGKFLIIGNNQRIKLFIEVVNLLHTMTGLTGALHVITTIFPGDNLGNLFGSHGFFQFAVFKYIGFVLGVLSDHRRNITRNVGNSTVVEDNTIQLNGNFRTQGPGNTITNVMGARSNSAVQFHIGAHVTGRTGRS